MKIAVTGKGGVGKTTVAAFLARAWRELGYRVIAVDADPDANLAGTLGYRGADITPLVGLKALLDRVGGGDGFGGFLKMNPKVDDIPAQFSVAVDGISVLVMGTIDRGRRGCACPEHVLLREVLRHLMLCAGEHVVVDMEAGIEHLGRGTAEAVDDMLVVVEPGWASLQTATRVAKLAGDLGITRVLAVGNKIRSGEDAAFVREGLGDIPLVATLPYDAELERRTRSGEFDRQGAVYKEMMRLAKTLAGRAPGSRRAQSPKPKA